MYKLLLFLFITVPLLAVDELRVTADFKIENLQNEKDALVISKTLMDQIKPILVNINVSENVLKVVENSLISTPSIVKLVNEFGYDIQLIQYNNIRIKVDGIVCSFCIMGIKKRFLELDSISDTDFNLEKGFLDLNVFSDKHISDNIIEEIFLDSGYKVKEINRN